MMRFIIEPVAFIHAAIGPDLLAAALPDAGASEPLARVLNTTGPIRCLGLPSLNVAKRAFEVILIVLEIGQVLKNDLNNHIVNRARFCLFFLGGLLLWGSNEGLESYSGALFGLNELLLVQI